MVSHVRAWWLRATDDERRDVAANTAWISTATAGLMALLLITPSQYASNRAAAEYAGQVAEFAKLTNDGATPDQPLAQTVSIDQDWLTDLSEYAAADTADIRPQLARYEQYVEGVQILNAAASRSLYTTAERASEEHRCLATAIYYEARSERLEGQLAVAEVIMNRVADARYPNSICEVVYQGSRRNIGCQFTFTCDGATARSPRGRRWTRAQSIAAHVVLDLNERQTSGATHYHADYVDPIWNAGLVKTRTIGTHIFYRFPRGREWAQYRAALAAKRSQRLRVIETASSAATPEATGVIAEASAAPAP